MNAKLPQHIAIVMDGNGRWATDRQLPRASGHREGARVVNAIVEYCGKSGIPVLSLFAFSLENRKRPVTEVQFLMKLMQESLERHMMQLHEQNVQLRVIGDRRFLSDALCVLIEKAEKMTRNNIGLVLVIALNYSGRWDIAQATQRLLSEVTAPADHTPEAIESKLSAYLCLSDLPQPDLFIRTSGEQRISNFMLWQLAYSELYFAKPCWPDFSTDDLDQAIQFYQRRQRRFGLTSEQVEKPHA